jgi:hypothetical protein
MQYRYTSGVSYYPRSSRGFGALMSLDRGRFKVWDLQHRDRCGPFARNMSNLNTKNPPRGGGQKSGSIKDRGPVPPSLRDFFSGNPNFQGLAATAIANSRIKSMSDRSARGWIRVFILSGAGRGVSKVYDHSRCQPRWFHAHKIFGAVEL